MFRGIVNPSLRNMDGIFVKIVDGLLSTVIKILTVLGKSSILDVLLCYEFAPACFSSHLTPHQSVQYTNLTRANFLD